MQHTQRQHVIAPSDIRKKSLSLALCTLTLALGACGTKVPESLPEPVQPLVQFMISNTPGASGELEDPQFGGLVRITLEDAFLSASGESCKRATAIAAGREPEVVIACRAADGVWRLAPRVWGGGLSY